MTFIDDRGRLFGRLNFIDGIVGLLVVATLGFVAVGYTLFRLPQSPAASTKAATEAITTCLFMLLLLNPTSWCRSAAPPSREALDVGFDQGLRRLVIEWDATDPRPPQERRQALFEFMYQTYQSSAWIPQSLFDSNLVSQAVAGDVPNYASGGVTMVHFAV